MLGFLQAEPARAPQYVAFFAAGILAFRHDWLRRLPERTGYAWLAIGVGLSSLLFVTGGPNSGYFTLGGANLTSLCWPSFEAAMCTGLSVGLLVLFREKLGGTSTVLRTMSDSSFGVCVLHLPVVVALQFAIAGRDLAPLILFAVVAVFATLITFPLARLARQLPGVRAVL